MMLLWSSIDDYTRGLESNLVAEMVGLIVGVAITYLIVDRIVQSRLRSQNRPLLKRLRERIDYAVAMMAYSWGIVLGVAGTDDAVEASRGSLIAEISSRLDSHSAESLAGEMRVRDPEGPLLLGTFTLENANRVIMLSDRLSHITATDGTLEGLLTDLDGVVEDIAIAVRHWGRIDSASVPAAETGLVELCRGAFTKGLSLKIYVDAHL